MLGAPKVYHKADTIVEVMIAIAVFSVVVVSALGIMSSGLNSTQRTLESTLVRQEMDSQSSTLRFLHNAFIASALQGAAGPAAGTPAAEWSNLVTYIQNSGVSSASAFGTCVAPSKAFILNAKKATYVTATTSASTFKPASLYSTVTYDGVGNITGAQGIWVEGLRSATVSGTGYIDFHIRACWYSVGQTAPMTLGTIVRLYDPR